MNELENWLTKELKEGVEVAQKFPCKYESDYGFGYEIVIEGPNRQRYAVIFTRRTEEDPLVIYQVNKVNWNKLKDEEVHVEGLKGREISLVRKEARTYWSESSKLAITGTLYLK